MDNRRADNGSRMQQVHPARASITIDTDAFEPATDIDGNPIPEPEWEYGTALKASNGTLWDFESDSKRHAYAHVAECDTSDHNPDESCVVVRRRVGPWEPVEEEQG